MSVPKVFTGIIAVFLMLLGLKILWLIYMNKINLETLISEPKTPDGKGGEASMSRFQFMIFTFVIAFAILIVMFNKPGEIPQIPSGVYALLGISGGSYAVSKGIQTSRDTTMQKQEVEKAAAGAAAAGGKTP